MLIFGCRSRFLTTFSTLNTKFLRHFRGIFLVRYLLVVKIKKLFQIRVLHVEKPLDTKFQSILRTFWKFEFLVPKIEILAKNRIFILLPESGSCKHFLASAIFLSLLDTQSIPLSKKPIGYRFSSENSNFSPFSLLYIDRKRFSYPESGSEKRFQCSPMRVNVFSQKILVFKLLGYASRTR